MLNLVFEENYSTKLCVYTLVLSLLNITQSFKLQPHKMVKHTQTIRQQPMNYLSDYHFVSLQTRNKEFSGQGSIAWNQGTSINNHLQHEKKMPLREKSPFFPLETLKNCSLNKKFYSQMTTIRAFFLKIGTLFSNFRKRAGETSLPPPSSYASGLAFKGLTLLLQIREYWKYSLFF